MERSSLFEQFDTTSRRNKFPAATYRLQFNTGFTFADASAIAAYLAALGVSDIYASPIFQARSSSTHGYDICDFNRFNQNLGSDTDFENFSDTLHSRDLGLVLDMVPNHMGIGEPGNRWWMDVLENGPDSAYAPFFDIHWSAPHDSRDKRVVLPILGNHYGTVLENAELQIAFDRGEFFIAYYQTRLPLCPGSYRTILRRLLARVLRTGEIELAQSIRALLETPFDTLASRRGDAETDSLQSDAFQDLKRSLSVLSESNPAFPQALQPLLAGFNGKAGNARSFDRLDGLIRKQHYRLAFWRAGSSEINYRRFFDISDLAAVRMEAPEVFEASHQLIQRLMFERRITGLRIDHPDGLWDPAHYFRRLQACFLIQSHKQLNPEEAQSPEIRCAASDWLQERAGGNEQAESNWPFYVVAEKILSEGEDLPRDWTIHGTTGYETLNLINSLFVRQTSEPDFDRIYSQFIGRTCDYHEQVRENKRRILETSLSSELNALARLLKKLASQTRYGCDLTSVQLLSGLTEFLAAFPVYRTYVTDETRALSEADKAVIEKAMADASAGNAQGVSAAFTFLADTLLLRPLAPNSKDIRRQQIEFIMRFQQLAGPAMAKGLEDTTFYRYNRLVSLNEVGGHPNRFGISLSEFHACNSQRQAAWPNSLTATATHDTKRGEDVRARINVLSEIPVEWEEALIRWRSINSERKGSSHGNPAPDENDEYLFYQILTGVWPSNPCAAEDIASIKDRVTAYMLKAIKEAKVHTSWTDPNAEYEEAVRRFVSDVLDPSSENSFLPDFVRFQSRIAFFGAFNSLAQTLLKITVPGIPDFYQGTELWDLSLVDPDNRRPVDYPVRRRMLAEIENHANAKPSERGAFASKLLTDWRTGQVKQYLIHAALHFRRRNSQLFSLGQYQGLNATGSKSENVCAFARMDKSTTIIVVSPRLIASITDRMEHFPIGDRVWSDTRIEMPRNFPMTHLRNVLSGETVPLEPRNGAPTILLGKALQRFPVALLEAAS